MSSLRFCLFSYLVYLVLNTIAFIADTVVGQGGSGKIFNKFWLFILILSGVLIFIGTFNHLTKHWQNVNKIILTVLSFLAALLQLLILFFVFFFVAMLILAPILIKLGFYVTMP